MNQKSRKTTRKETKQSLLGRTDAGEAGLEAFNQGQHIEELSALSDINAAIEKAQQLAWEIPKLDKNGISSCQIIMKAPNFRKSKKYEIY